MIVKNERKSPLALLPLLVFVGFFLVSGMLLDDFYALPAPIAVIMGILTAFLLFYKEGLNENMQRFIKGCGDVHVVTMCLIVLLCGAFSVVMTELGAVSQVALIAQKYLSERYLYAGVFAMASFLSFASGTSVGAISTLTPVVAGFAQIEGVGVALLAGCVLSGAMFGDNLSFTSDTTLVATQSQGVGMKDKFKTNAWIALPAAFLSLIILFLVGAGSTAEIHFSAEISAHINWLQLTPYVAVIVLATVGVNVFSALLIGTLWGMIIGMCEQGWTWLASANHFYNGMLKMSDSLLVFMLTGGLAHLVEKQGGLNYLLFKMKHFMTSPIRAKVGIGFLVSLLDAAIANNTIAIMVAGPIAKRIGTHFKIPATQTACILDILSCVVQGIIPYGAQMLILLSLLGVKIPYLTLLGSMYYIWLLFFGALFYFLILSLWVDKKSKTE